MEWKTQLPLSSLLSIKYTEIVGSKAKVQFLPLNTFPTAFFSWCLPCVSSSSSLVCVFTVDFLQLNSCLEGKERESKKMMMKTGVAEGSQDNKRNRDRHMCLSVFSFFLFFLTAYSRSFLFVCSLLIFLEFLSPSFSRVSVAKSILSLLSSHWTWYRFRFRGERETGDQISFSSSSSTAGVVGE